MPTCIDLINEAKQLVGIPYHHQGRNAAGVDCVGFLLLAVSRLGLDVRDAPTAYSGRPDGTLEKELARFCDKYEGVPKIGEVWTMWQDVPGQSQHLVLYAGPIVIHACNKRSKKRVIQHGVPPQWTSRITGRWLIKGIDYGDISWQL